MVKRGLTTLAGGALGALFYLWIGGTRLLDPTEYAWLMKLDWRIHFLGWHLFRNEPWRWPPGRMESYQHAPDGTAIIFTDSIPLLAFLFKPFNSLLPMPFQYIGLWLFLCFVLQGVFGVLITRIWTKAPWLQLLGAAYFVLMPTLLIRVGHPSLCAHFLLLWAIWLYFRSTPTPSRGWGSHLGLALCAGLLHPYLAVMTMAVLGAVLVRDHTALAIGRFAAATSVLLAAWWASGLFTVSGAENFASEGIGYYSMNLLSPITPSGWSSVLPALPTATGGQAYEGFQYFGAGALGLIAVAAGLVAIRPGDIRWGLVTPLLLVSLACAVYALSPRVTLGSEVVLDWWTPALDRWALFRATGRFFWLLAYLAVAGALAVVVSRLPHAVAASLLSAGLLLQLIDLHGAHAERRATTRSDEFHAWHSALPSPVWHNVLPHYDHIVLVPARQCGSAPIGFEAPAFLAGLHGLTINSAEVARFNESARRSYCARLEGEIAAGAVADNKLYILDATHAAALRAAAQQPVVCGTIDAALVCVTADSYASWRDQAHLQ
jgi:Family of unknown function (DUF6311)